jgi:hypothetical protein
MCFSLRDSNTGPRTGGQMRLSTNCHHAKTFSNMTICQKRHGCFVLLSIHVPIELFFSEGSLVPFRVITSFIMLQHRRGILRYPNPKPWVCVCMDDQGYFIRCYLSLDALCRTHISIWTCNLASTLQEH